MPPAPLPRPSAVLFDMDGLIFDTERLYGIALRATADRLGLRDRITEAVEAQTIGLGWPETWKLLADVLGDAGDPLAFRQDWLAAFDRMTPTDLVMKPGVVELLDALDDLAIPRAVATGAYRAVASRFLDAHGLTTRFDAIITHEDYTRGKPAPDPFLTAAARLSVAPQACWALEDSANGIRSAHAAGMVAIMVPDLLQPAPDLAALCHHIAPDLHDVRARLIA
ncbi:HAD-IA family hydrolase [Novosphingobium sp. FSY-8]|uniref:HAD-IA family hydrolase n=2 Tax=Novosphingobium ovatum TaxID=1908523 RepID=A0ABW9XEW2_9SPHN|nr:HAD-IA family hydrolase [Novosphingobium ovatum]